MMFVRMSVHKQVKNKQSSENQAGIKIKKKEGKTLTVQENNSQTERNAATSKFKCTHTHIHPHTQTHAGKRSPHSLPPPASNSGFSRQRWPYGKGKTPQSASEGEQSSSRTEPPRLLGGWCPLATTSSADSTHFLEV